VAYKKLRVAVWCSSNGVGRINKVTK